VEVRIGVQHAPREIALDSADAADDIQKAVEKAVKDGSGTLILTDEKGRRVIIPAEKLAYVEIAEADSRRVGFAAL
jgi:C4-type Zn-finger protein